MKRIEQLNVNVQCVENYNKAMEELANTNGYYKVENLRTCQAQVLTTENYYILRSYNTIVAVIDIKTDTLYDVLRYVFGYTSTSAQHISKFSKDYGKGKWSCNHELRFYSV